MLVDSVKRHMAKGNKPESLASVGERLRLLRLALHYTQGQIAAMVGVSQAAWSQYENGIHAMDVQIALRLQALTGAPLEWVFSGIVTRIPHNLFAKLTKNGKQSHGH